MAPRTQAVLAAWATVLAFLPLAGAWAVEPPPSFAWGPAAPRVWGGFAPRPVQAGYAPPRGYAPQLSPYQFAYPAYRVPQASPFAGNVQLHPPVEPEELPAEPAPPRPKALVDDSPLSGTPKQKLRTELAETKQQVHDDATLMKETLVQLKEGHATNQKLTEIKDRLQKENADLKRNSVEGQQASNELADEKRRADAQEAELKGVKKVHDERHRKTEKTNYDIDSLDKLIEDGNTAKAELEKQHQLLSDEVHQMKSELSQKQSDMKRSVAEAEAKRQASLPSFAEAYGKNGKIEKETEKEQLEAKNAIGAQRLLQRKSTELISEIARLRQTNANLRQHIDKLSVPTKKSKAALARLRRYVKDMPVEVAAPVPPATDQEGAAPDEAA